MPATSTDILLARIAANLIDLAAVTDDNRCRVAAGILLGRPGGRRKYDRDATAVAEIVALVETGQSPTPTDAARLVAKSLRERIPVESTMTRLLGKYRSTYRKK